MPRTKPPRVIIPRKTLELVNLINTVNTMVGEHPHADDGNPATLVPATLAALDNLGAVHNDIISGYDNWQTKLNASKAAKAALDSDLETALEELRNLRDSGFVAFQPDPANIVEYGFSIYTSPEGGGGDDGSGGDPDPGDGGGDPVV